LQHFFRRWGGATNFANSVRKGGCEPREPPRGVRAAEILLCRLQSGSYFFCLLWATGMRVKSISRLRGKQICAAEDCLEVQVRIDKGRRKRSLRALLRLPWEWLGGRPPYNIEHSINSLPDDHQPFAEFTATKVNYWLKSMGPKAGVGKCTTYSFRRAYINMIIQRCNGNMPLITSHTLHLTPTMIDTHYRQWQKNVPKQLGGRSNRASENHEEHELETGEMDSDGVDDEERIASLNQRAAQHKRSF